MFVAYFDFYLLLICIMLWLFAANKVVYISMSEKSVFVTCIYALHMLCAIMLFSSRPGLTVQ